MNNTLAQLDATIVSRKGVDPGSSYVAKLLAKAPDAPLKKVAEETGEFIMACKDADAGKDKAKIVYEAADLWFHTLVALAHYGLSGQDVLDELARREGLSGLVEKVTRPQD
jgi:phosphoribosyl-ATP pyrophosphohydrolase